MSNHQNSTLSIKMEKELIRLFGQERNVENAVIHYLDELLQIIELEKREIIYMKNLKTLGLSNGDLRLLKRARLIAKGKPRGMRTTEKLKEMLRKMEYTSDE